MTLSKFVWAGLTCYFLCACAGYRLGPTNGLAAGARSVRIYPFQNQTPEPGLVEPVVSALRKSFQQDGTYRLSTQGDGDISVRGILTRYERQGLSFQPGDILTVRDFNVVLAAKVTAVERGTGRVILDQEVSGRTTLRVGSALASVERLAWPLLAEDLARNVAALLVEGKW